MLKVLNPNIESFTNCKMSNQPLVLHRIHEEEVNIAIYNRSIDALFESITALIDKNVEFRASGDIAKIVKEMNADNLLSKHSNIIEDINMLLLNFSNIVEGDNFRLLFATIQSNMCTKFHSDLNDLRLLCTYSGPGTLWLTDDNIDQNALSTRAENHSIVIDESKIQEVQTGAVAILKGAIYPNEQSNPVVHRSPTIENKGVKRLLLRIDTNQTMNLWA